MRTPPAYFDRLYSGDVDPWGFQTRWYEHRKYALTLAALPERHYRRAFEPGCSIGVLSEQLAGRCDELISVDANPLAVERARGRLDRLDHVMVGCCTVPDEWPAGRFDLVVLSEILYFFDEEELGAVLDRVRRCLSGDLVAVHWRGQTDYPMSGDDVHRMLRRTAGFEWRATYQERDFVVDVLSSLPRAF